VGAPGFEFAGCDFWLGDVVEDELLVRVPVYKADGFFELALEDEDVVDEAGFGEGADASVEIGIAEKAGGFGLDYVAEAYEFWLGCEFGERCFEVGRCDGCPSYDSANLGTGFGEFEKPVGFLECLAGLDADGAVDLCVRQLCDEVLGEKVAAEGGHAVVDPAVFGGGVLPEMMVRVDDRVGVHAVTMLLASGTWRNLRCFVSGWMVCRAVGYSLEMRVRMFYFGVLRERLGGSQEWLELVEGATVAEVLNVYRERLADFPWDSIAVAVNQEYAKSDVVLEEGAELALLPPVSGGLERYAG
jgi:molybdopterin converting factor small subunit